MKCAPLDAEDGSDHGAGGEAQGKEGGGAQLTTAW